MEGERQFKVRTLLCLFPRYFLTDIDEEYLMLSDTDLFITCRKFRNDPFFQKLRYMRNKLELGEEIVVSFEGGEEKFLRDAT
ncbi:unnamed protein product [Sphagnum balticum]